MSLQGRLTEIVAERFLGGFRGKRKYEYEGKEEELYVFGGRIPAGMNVLWGDTLVNERLFEEGNESVLEYVFVHERGHREQNAVWQAIHGGLRWIVGPYELLAHIIVFTVSSFTAVTGSEIIGITVPLATTTIHVQLFLITGIVTLAYLGELGADFYAIEAIGIEKYVRAKEDYKRVFQDRNLLELISMRLTHPPKWMVVGAYQLLH